MSYGKSSARASEAQRARAALRRERRSPASITPAGVVDHLYGYATTHGNLSVPFEGRVLRASESAVRGRLSGIRQCCDDAGRVGPYAAAGLDDRRGIGNPGHSTLVTEFCRSYHKLLFDFERSSLVMIDEPEISLHVTWQQEFLGDLDKIREVTGHSFLIATHSPSIVGEHWDRIVEMPLEEGLS